MFSKISNNFQEFDDTIWEFNRKYNFQILSQIMGELPVVWKFEDTNIQQNCGYFKPSNLKNLKDFQNFKFNLKGLQIWEFERSSNSQISESNPNL